MPRMKQFKCPICNNFLNRLLYHEFKENHKGTVTIDLWICTSCNMFFGNYAGSIQSLPEFEVAKQKYINECKSEIEKYKVIIDGQKE